MRFLRWISLLTIGGSLIWGLPAVPAAAQQQGVGEICVRAFNDLNGDGTYTAPDEPLIANVTFILSNETGRLASYRTDGTELEEKPYCFGNLAVGQYTVQARPDVNKVKGKSTTPGQWVVPLASGAQYDIAYGVQLSAQPESNQAAGNNTSSSGMSPIGRIALGLLGIGVLGVAGFMAYSILRRARSA